MKAYCFRTGVTVALLTLCLSVSAFVPQPFFAPMSLAQAQEQAMRQYAAAQGIDVTDVPAGQLTTEKVIARMSEKIKRESGPRADAVVQQYMLSESDFAAALQRADAPEELLSLRTDLQQRMCQIVYGCSQVGCSNEDAVKRAMPAMDASARRSSSCRRRIVRSLIRWTRRCRRSCRRETRRCERSTIRF